MTDSLRTAPLTPDEMAHSFALKFGLREGSTFPQALALERDLTIYLRAALQASPSQPDRERLAALLHEMELGCVPVMCDQLRSGYDGPNELSAERTRAVVMAEHIGDADRLFAAGLTVPAAAPALRIAAWRLINAAESLERHARAVDDPAHRSWLPSASADVAREVRLTRAAVGPEPAVEEYAAEYDRLRAVTPPEPPTEEPE